MQRFKQWLPAILWAATILYTSSDAFSAGQSNEWLEWIFGPVPDWVNVAFRKAMHVVGYAILGALSATAASRPASALAFGFVVSCLDEFRQSRSLARSGSGWDVALDMCAAAFAVWLAFRFRERRRGRLA
jgi:VanZ family protein